MQKASFIADRLVFSRVDLVAVGLSILSIVLYSWLPIALWLLPVWLCLLYLSESLYRSGPRQAIAICSIATVPVFVCIGVYLGYGFHNPLQQTTRFDDYEYYLRAQAIASAWGHGFYPHLSLKGARPYIGSLHTGYERLLGLFFLIGGPGILPGAILNMLCLVFLPLFACFSAFALWPTSSKELSLPAFAAAALCVLHPGFYYWANWLHKDSLVLLLFAASYYFVARTISERRPLMATGFLACFAMLCITRAYCGFALAAGMIAYAISYVPRRFVVFCASLILLIVFAVSYSTSGGDYISQLLFSISLKLPADANSSFKSLIYFATGIPRLLLGPYGWIRAYGEFPQYGLYPGMWFLYLFVYPLAAAGIFRAFSDDHRQSIIPLVAFSLSALVFLLAYGGDAPRQRIYLEYILIVYAAHGISHKRIGWYALAIYASIALFAIVQFATLQSRYK
jgi:hypothetical protein